MKYCVFFILISTFIFPSLCHATAAPSDITSNLNTFTQPTGIAQDSITNRLVEGMLVVYQLTGIVFFIIALYAGFMWLTAQGNDDTIKRARGFLIGAVVGILLVVGAYGITIFITDRLASDFGVGYSVPNTSQDIML